MNTWGDSVVAELDVPLEEVNRVLVRQAADTMLELVKTNKISAVRSFTMREGTCVMQPFCDHVMQNPHRVAGYLFEAE